MNSYKQSKMRSIQEEKEKLKKHENASLKHKKTPLLLRILKFLFSVDRVLSKSATRIYR